MFKDKLFEDVIHFIKEYRMDRKLTEDEKYCIRLAYYLGKQH